MSTRSEAILQVRDLSISLPPGSDRQLAVENLTLDIHANETLCVVGESGSGKSLLANAIMGLLPHGVKVSSGSILYDGRELTKLAAKEYQGIRGRRIAMVFQEPMSALNPVLTIHEQIDEVLRAHGESDGMKRQRRIIELLTAMGLPDPEILQHAYPFRLSGGQRQRVMMAMALALEPDVLIADEPTTALDVTTQKQILMLLREIQRERHLAIVFITHDFGVVADIASQVAVMQKGALVECGSVEEILNRPQHPYTQQLIDVVRKLSRDSEVRTSAGTRPILEIAEITKTYVTKVGWLSGNRREVKALQGINLTLAKGETLGLVGESGSGKTTLGQIIVRLIEEDSGSVSFEGEPFASMSRGRFAELRPRIQMIFQDPSASLNPRHKIARVLTETQMLHGVSASEAVRRAERMLDLVRLDRSAMGRYPHEFSGGQKQRVGIARALVLEPTIIVADEPVSALDVSVQAQVLDLLQDIRQQLGLSMIFITHDLRVAARVCDHIAVMRKGEIVEIGESGQVLQQPQHDYTKLLCASMPGSEWLAA